MSIQAIDLVHPEDFNCIVCLEPMIDVDIYQCCRGEHNICGICAPRVQPAKCPIDRSEGKFIPDPRRKRQIQNLVKKCPHRFCNHQTLPWLLEEHLQTCLYKEIKCPMCETVYIDKEDESKDNLGKVLHRHFLDGTCQKKYNGEQLIHLTTFNSFIFIENVLKRSLSCGTVKSFFEISYKSKEVKHLRVLYTDNNSRNVQVRLPCTTIWDDKNTIKKVSVFIEKGQQIEICPYMETQIIDTLDTKNKWYEAEIMAIRHDKREVLVHYLNWGVKWDEWISFDSPRLAPHRKYTVGPNIVPASLVPV